VAMSDVEKAAFDALEPEDHKDFWKKMAAETQLVLSQKGASSSEPTKPKCAKCGSTQHPGECWKCAKCGGLGHKTEKCWKKVPATRQEQAAVPVQQGNTGKKPSQRERMDKLQQQLEQLTSALMQRGSGGTNPQPTNS